MYDPCIPEVTEMVERMANIHKRELVRQRVLWHTIKSDNGTVLQLVPVLDILYKF